MPKAKKVLRLFLVMVKIGLFTFGGGYAMIALLESELVAKRNWLEKDEFLDMVAVAESTPGPVAVNMATFVGASQGGLLGSLLATLGVVLPSFVIILLIAAILKNLRKYAGVNAFLSGVRPCVVAMILATALSMALSTLLGFGSLQGGLHPDARALGVFGVLAAVHLVWKACRKKSPPPIAMIALSAVLGIVFWGI